MKHVKHYKSENQLRFQMPNHKIVPSLLLITLKSLEKLTTELVINAAHDIANKVCDVKDVDHEHIIEQTRKITRKHVEEIQEMIFDHVVQTLHQDVSLQILKER